MTGLVILHIIIVYAIAMRGKALVVRLKTYKQDKDLQSVVTEFVFFVLVIVISALIYRYFLYDIFYKDYF